jgi:phenylalanyl-tRNA synthetase alpha chain
MSRPDVQEILARFDEDLARVTDLPSLEEVRRRHAGKKSPLKDVLRSLKDLPPDERPEAARSVQAAQERMEQALARAADELENRALRDQLAREWQDLSPPGIAPRRGGIHPLTEVERRCMEVLRQLGFEWVDGPEVEHPRYNFDLLNIPEHHPARDMQDTFWVDGGWLLRSHTTTVQARLLESRPPPPVRVASYGRAYRNEAVDATHTAMFHQLEGIWVERGLTFAHLKGVLAFLARSLYGERRIRFKPKFYPYTEPSAGLDLACVVCEGAGETDGEPCAACHGAGWITLLGSGMIHPRVLRGFGYDPDEVSGIAFGLGTTRMASQWAGISRALSLYEPDVRVFRRLRRGPP